MAQQLNDGIHVGAGTMPLVEPSRLHQEKTELPPFETVGPPVDLLHRASPSEVCCIGEPGLNPRAIEPGMVGDDQRASAQKAYRLMIIYRLPLQISVREACQPRYFRR